MSKADPIFGVDISGWQRGIDLGRVKSEGYDFCIVKATEGPYPDGTSFTNPAYAEQMHGAKAAGLIVGAYHFLVETPAKAQVDHFLNVVGDVADKILVVDYEAYPTAGYSHLDPTMKTLEAFIAELRRRTGGHPIVVYAGQGYWNSPPPNGPITHLDVTTWDAWYQHMRPGYGSALYEEARAAGMGWGKRWGDQEPVFWQFSQAGKVAGLQIDVDAFQGTRDQLLALIGSQSALQAPTSETGGEVQEDKIPANPSDRPPVGNGAPRKAGTFWDAIDYLRPAIGGRRTPYWVWEEGIIPDGPGAFAINRQVPSIEYVRGEPGIFCFTGDTLVSAKDIEKSYRRLYSGEVVTIKTAGGKKLTGTPNHPILTDKGWLPLKALRKGVDVLGGTRFGHLAGSDVDNDDEPARFEQVHRSLADTGVVDGHAGTPFDFHGDGGKGEVDVVIPKRVLRHHLQSPFGEQDVEFGFPDAPYHPIGEASPGRSFGPIELGAFLDAAPLHSGPIEPPLDARRGHPEPSGDLRGGLSGEVRRDKIVSVDIKPFSGHVYNLQTASGRYLANGILAHNCAGVTNLILRHAGKRVPTKGDLSLDGGLAAYFRGYYGDGYYTGYDEPFDMAKAKRWADETNCGVMIGKGYYGPGLDDQGHVAVLLPRYTDGKYYVLQSYGGYAKWPGLNWDRTIEQSHDGGYYKLMVHPENWLLYKGDEY